MKPAIYFLSFLTQVSLLLAGLPVSFKCLLWDTPCLTGKALAVSTFIATALPQLGTKTLDTMIIDSLHIDDNGLKVDMKNMQVQGMRDVVIDNVSIDTSSRIIRLLFHTDFKVKSTYKTEGSLLSLPIYGEGNYTMRLNNVLIDMAMPFDIIQGVQERDVIDLKGYQYGYDVRDGSEFYLDNLYYGDKQRSKTMHRVLHQNWKLLTIQYGKYLFDKVNEKIFNSIRLHTLSSSLDTIVLY